MRVVEGGGGRVGYFRGAAKGAFDTDFAAEDVLFEEAEPIFVLRSAQSS